MWSRSRCLTVDLEQHKQQFHDAYSSAYSEQVNVGVDGCKGRWQGKAGGGGVKGKD